MAANFPLVINFQGDYGMKVIVVDDALSMQEIAKTAADQLVGVVVKPLPAGARLFVRRHGEAQPLPDALTIRDAGFVKMETLDIYFH